MKAIKEYNFWLLTGSQNLYGPETLEQVAAHSKEMTETLNANGGLPCKIVFKPVIKSVDEAFKMVKEANYDDSCAGVIAFMHTFSPSKMWIGALASLQKPYCHLHTQFNREIPDEGIDMDFMNLNQSAHGDREHGFIAARLRLPRKVIAGYWRDEKVARRLAGWMRSAVGIAAGKQLRVMRFGDNMREVAVTEGDKVEVQKVLGWQVNSWGTGLLAQYIKDITDSEIDDIVSVYKENYTGDTENEAVRYQAREQAAIAKLLKENNCMAFTDSFEDLYSIRQLPGLAAQDLMRQGFGFGGEGDWKTSALLSVVKSMSQGLFGGESFMEDYTYHLEAGRELCLGAHMLEVCPTIAAEKAKIEIHPLGIGDREPPARLVFEGRAGEAILITIVDMGGRLRMIVHDIECVKPIFRMPNLPVARTMWRPQPNFETGAEAWITAGGAHHSVLSYSLDAEIMRDYAKMAGIEFVHINKDTVMEKLERDLMLCDIAYKLK